MNLVEDWHLVQSAARGDMDAFAGLVRRYQRAIVHFCYRMTGSMADAEDIAQETFLCLYRSLRRLRPDSAFSTVLFCFARNAALNHLRASGRHRRRVEAFTSAAAQAPPRLSERPDRVAQADETVRLVEAGLATMSPEYREALVLREMQGFEYSEIALILGCPVGTVRSRLARAREQLRAYVLREGKDVL